MLIRWGNLQGGEKCISGSDHHLVGLKGREGSMDCGIGERINSKHDYDSFHSETANSESSAHVQCKDKGQLQLRGWMGSGDAK